MQITFDPRDPNALASVLAIITALHPELVPHAEPIYAYGTCAEPVAQAAQAFDAPSPTEAFAPPPLAEAPTAPVASPAAVTGVATTPTPPPAPSPANSVELDADGLPWDARIHSGPADKRPKNADNRWRRGRGVTDEQFNVVAAELRQVMGAPAPLAAPPVAPVPAPPETAPAASAPIPAPPAPPPAPEPVAMESGPVVAAPAASVATFTDLMRKVTRMQTAGLVTVEGTSQIAQALGLTGLRDLMQRPDLVGSFDALLPAEAA
jgi:hypothetical protein